VRQLRTVSYSVDCSVNTFSSANYTMLTSLDEYFFDYNFQWMNLASQFESCVAVCFTQFVSMAISWAHISQWRI